MSISYDKEYLLSLTKEDKINYIQKKNLKLF